MCNILYSSDEADKINEKVASSISPNLFLFYGYNPKSLNFISDDAKFVEGINNLYKLIHDTGCIVAKMKYILMGNANKPMDQAYDAFYEVINIVDSTRTLLNHNNNVYGLFYSHHNQRLKRWCGEIIGKDSPENCEDYKKMQRCLEKFGEIISDSCIMFINDVAESMQKEEIISRWTNATYEWYAKKRDIFYNELANELMINIANSSDRERLNSKGHRKICGILNEWIKNSFYNKYYVEIDRIKSYKENISRIITNQESLKKAEKIMKERIKEQEKEIDEMKERIISDLHVADDTSEHIYFTEYFFKNLVSELKDIAKENPGINLSPDDLMQKFISERFNGVRLPAIRG